MTTMAAIGILCFTTVAVAFGSTFHACTTRDRREYQRRLLRTVGMVIALFLGIVALLLTNL